MLVVGLTGGIGAGKSTALRLFADLGAWTVSADRLVHEAYDLPGVRRAVVDWLDESYLSPDGSVDRKKVAARIFARPEERAFLEGILHPLVRRRLEAFIDGVRGRAVVVAEVPLLFEARQEAQLDHLFQVTVAVGAPSELRRARTKDRFTDVDFARREAAQVTDEHRRELADYFFLNEGTEADLRAWVSCVWQDLHRRYPQVLASG